MGREFFQYTYAALQGKSLEELHGLRDELETKAGGGKYKRETAEQKRLVKKVIKSKAKTIFKRSR